MTAAEIMLALKPGDEFIYRAGLRKTHLIYRRTVLNTQWGAVKIHYFTDTATGRTWDLQDREMRNRIHNGQMWLA